MNERVPTVKILNESGEPTVINFSDYDEKKHKLAPADALTPLQPLAPSEQVSLFGSSIQPASWNLGEGKTLSLADVVAEAHKRSGVSGAEWNNLPQALREENIAAVVAEMVPTPESTLSVTRKRTAGGEFTYSIVDIAGKQLGEDFENEADAHAKLKLLESK